LSVAEVNCAVVYCPSSVRCAVWVPSETISVPLRLLPASAKPTVVVAELKAMSERSRYSGLPKPEMVPAESRSPELRRKTGLSENKE
jgi:hypothetical protein